MFFEQVGYNFADCQHSGTAFLSLAVRSSKEESARREQGSVTEAGGPLTFFFA
jgi:hypothetical protein